MSNVKQVEISGTMPFNCDENQKIKGWLASMNTPCFGLRITWGVDVALMVTNDHGGKTAHYDFRISGREAVSYSAIESLKAAILSIGGRVEKSKVHDCEAS